MRTKFFRFWVTAGAMWAAMCSLGGRMQAMQAEPNPQEQEIAIFIGGDAEEGEEGAEQSAAPKFWLGIMLKPIEGDLAKYLDSSDGVLVDSVYAESPASQAGLEKGDIIVAVGDVKLTDPKSLLAQMKSVSAGEDGKVPPLKLKVLRKGEMKSMDLIPVVRPPEMLKVTVNAEGTADELNSDDAHGVLGLSFDLNNKSPEEIEKMIEKLHGANSDVRILRFGTPAKVPDDAKATMRLEIHKSEDGKSLEISIIREGDGPAKVTVNRDGESQEYTSDKMDEMPEDVRKTVTEMLEKEVRVQVQDAKRDGVKESKNAADGKQAKDRIAEIRNRIALVAPNGINVEMKDVMDKEMAEKIRTMAKEIEARAHQTAKWTQAAAAMPAEIKELKSQVEALRAEIKELREQLKSTVKQSSDN